jgi:hypothetical protein
LVLTVQIRFCAIQISSATLLVDKFFKGSVWFSHLCDKNKITHFMEKLFYFFFLILFTTAVQSQSPQSFNYQGVARNETGVPYASQPISIKLSIHTGSANGTVEYSETRTVQTNQFGLFTIQIGSDGATDITGNFGAIKWAEGSKYLQTEISVDNKPYIDLGTTQMVSVPYAIHSQQARQIVFPFDTTVYFDKSNVLAIRNQATTAFQTMVLESVGGNALYAHSTKTNAIVGQSDSKNTSAIVGLAVNDSAIGVTGNVGAYNIGGAGVSGSGSRWGIGVKGNSDYRPGVQGFSLDSAGVMGISKNKVGVSGISETGRGGVHGRAGVNTSIYQFGVMGEAWGNSTGVLAKSNSASANALIVDGKLRILNNGSTPGVGKVLTSDEAGNATWQQPITVAFRASGLKDDVNQNIPIYTWKKILFNPSVRYNIGNGCNAENSIFFTPVTGIYHLYAQADWAGACPSTSIRIMMLRSGATTTIAEMRWGSTEKSELEMTPFVTTDILLQQNDAIWVEIIQGNSLSEVKSILRTAYKTYFTGHLMTRM